MNLKKKDTNPTPDALLNNNIAGVLNAAYDIIDPTTFQVQIKYGKNGFPPSCHKKSLTSIFLTQLAKVGLVDGPENDMLTVVGALYMADQLLHFPSPQQQFKDGMTNVYANGNLLIHCHDGGSRSVTVAALYIYYKFHTNSDVTFKTVYKNIICLRWNKATNHHPSLGICQTA